MTEPIYFGSDSFSVNGTHHGVIIRRPHTSQRLVPESRVSYSFRVVGPTVVSEATEEESCVRYRLYEYGEPTAILYRLATSHEMYGWVLDGKEVRPFVGEPYFEKCFDEEGFNSDNSVRTVFYPLRGDEKTFVGKGFGPGGWELQDTAFFPDDEC